MRILVFQHIAVEHPGIFRSFMAADGINWDTVELDQGDKIPQLSHYDALMVLDGPMDVWQEQQYPWLISEKQAIQHAVTELNLPYLGICLGHQLLATALGGQVGLIDKAEVGIMPIELTALGKRSPIFAGLPATINSLQWHSAAVLAAPLQSQILATSPACAVQALQVGDKAFSIQCHVELTTSTVAEWGSVPEYQQSLAQSLGEGALAQLENDALAQIADFNAVAKTLYDNFIAQIN